MWIFKWVRTLVSEPCPATKTQKYYCAHLKYLGSNAPSFGCCTDMKIFPTTPCLEHGGCVLKPGKLLC